MISPHALRQLEIDLGAEVLAEALIAYVRDTPRRLDGIVSAVQAGDAAACDRVAHALAGSAGAVGDADLDAACRALMAAAAANDHLAMHRRLDEVRTAAAASLAGAAAWLGPRRLP